MIPLEFRVTKGVIPADLAVEVVASYLSPAGEPRAARCAFELPLALVCQADLPLKNQQYMFTLESNRPSTPSLTELFNDLLGPAIAANPEIGRHAENVLTCVFRPANVDVTILISKKTGRFRLQSGLFRD